MNKDEWKEGMVKWLQGFAWLWFCTLTFRPGLTEPQARWRLLLWLGNLRKALGTPDFGYFAVREYGRTGGDLHYHVLVMGLSDAGPAAMLEWMRRWGKLGGDPRIGPFNPGPRGPEYILKDVVPDDQTAIELEMASGTYMQTAMEGQEQAMSSTVGLDDSGSKQKGEKTDMQVTQKGSKLVIEMNLQEPKLSSSGRNLVVATTRGPWESAVEIHGKAVTVVVNAYIPADEPAEQNEEEDVPDLDPTAKTKSRRRGRQ